MYKNQEPSVFMKSTMGSFRRPDKNKVVFFFKNRRQTMLIFPTGLFHKENSRR